MEYKTELHCHTSEISACAQASAREAVERCIENNYTTVVLTNHYSPYTLKIWECKNNKERAEAYFSPYKLALEAADGKLNIIMGMELRVHYNPNDYLVYGLTPEMLADIESYGRSLIEMDVYEAIRILREYGALVFQAHPFRNGMQMTPPEKLDGIETYNGAIRHSSRNDIAEIWAKKYGLIGISGSDFHRIGDEARGGIVTHKPITALDELMSTLKSKVYSLIKTQEGFLYE